MMLFFRHNVSIFKLKQSLVDNQQKFKFKKNSIFKIITLFVTLLLQYFLAICQKLNNVVASETIKEVIVKKLNLSMINFSGKNFVRKL
jgi:hypothetical protein